MESAAKAAYQTWTNTYAHALTWESLSTSERALWRSIASAAVLAQRQELLDQVQSKKVWDKDRFPDKY